MKNFVNNNGIEYLGTCEDGFKVVFLSRKGGISVPPYDSLNLSYSSGDDKVYVDKNYEKLLATFDLMRRKIIRLDQVHGSDVLVIKKGGETPCISGGFDAVVTDDMSLCLTVMTADCVPLFLFDKQKNVSAAVHAGWRGTALGIAKKAVKVMEEEFQCDSSSISAAIGPSIRTCCYEVSADVIEKLNQSVNEKVEGLYKTINGKVHADLQMYNITQLVESGVRRRKIKTTDFCTSCNSDFFFSFRRDKITGRQLSMLVRD